MALRLALIELSGSLVVSAPGIVLSTRWLVESYGMTVFTANIHTGVAPYPPDLLDRVSLHYGPVPHLTVVCITRSYVG